MSKQKILFVKNVDPGDMLSDLSDVIDTMAREYGCRCIVFVGTVSEETDQEEVAEASPVGENGHAKTAPRFQQRQQQLPGVTKRQVGQAVFLGDTNFPSSDDLQALRAEVARLGMAPQRIMVVNPHYGEYAIAAHLANPMASVFCVSDAHFEEEHLGTFRQNHAYYGNSIQLISEEYVPQDAQDLDALILVDIRPTDWNRYRHHIRQGGLFALVTTNGASPNFENVPDVIQKRLRPLTNSVYVAYREVIPQTAPQQPAATDTEAST